MKKIYVSQRQLIWLVLLWAGLISQATWAQTIPDAQWAHVGNTMAITADGNIATSDGGIVIKYGLNGDKLRQSGLLAASSSIAGKIQGCPPSVCPNVNGIAPIGNIRFLAPTADGGVLLLGNEFSTGFRVSARLNADLSRALYLSGGSGDYVLDTPDKGVVSVENTREYSNVTYSYTEHKIVTISRSSPQKNWSRTLSFPPPAPTTPDNSLTKANVVISTPDGGYLVAGYVNASGTDTPEVGWVAKLDGGGNVTWQKLLNNLPPTAGGESISAMQSITDVSVSADGSGYALVGSGNTSAGLKTALLELNGDGGFRRARSIDATATRAYITVYMNRTGKKYYAVGNSSLQNGVDPQILLVDPASDLIVAGKRTFDAPGDGPLNDIGVAGDGSLVFSTDNNQLVKLQPELLSLTQPTYDCATGSIVFNTAGGNGSPITYNAPGVIRSSPGSNTGIVEQGLRNDPKVIPITATQNGISITYNFDLQATCGPPKPKPPVYFTIPDLTFVVGQDVSFEFGYYFLDPTENVPDYYRDWHFALEGLPPGLRLESRTPYFSVPYAPILGNPTTAGTYTVNVTASTPGFRDNPIRTSFRITVLPNGQSPQPPQPPQPPTPPQPPVGGALALTQPSYNCQTGAITFNTTGGDGSPITFNAPGISRSSLTSNTGTVEPGLRGDPKPITITATQSSNTVSYVFDFKTYCANPQPPVDPQPPTPPTPPTGTALSLLAPTYDCGSGAITFNTSGGDGTPIEYAAAGITGWTTNPNQFVDKDSRTANDVQPFTLMARQNGVTVTYLWDLKAACGRARMGAGEVMATKLTLSVLGNPVSDAATVEIRGAAGKPLTLRLVDMSGKLLEQRVVEQPQALERQRFELPQPGLLLLRASSAGQSQTVKILKQ